MLGRDLVASSGRQLLETELLASTVLPLEHPKRSLAQGFSSKGPCQRGVRKLQIVGREKCKDFLSEHLRPKRSLNACLGHY